MHLSTYLTLPYRPFILAALALSPYSSFYNETKRNELNEPNDIERANMWAFFLVCFLKERKKDRKKLTYLGGYMGMCMIG